MTSKYDFDGKTVLVFGGSSGIGKAATLGFQAGGANVTVASRAPDATAFNETGVQCVACDVTNRRALQAMVQEVSDSCGVIDIVVNCAGAEMTPARLHETDSDTVDKIVAINLTGTINCMQAVLPAMSRPGSSIVNVSSVAGLKGFPGGAVYAAAKAGVCLLSRSAAMEYGPEGVRVNCVAPGLIETPMAERMKSLDKSMYKQMVSSMPFGRGGTPDEAASAILWLCSDDASFVNGETLVVDSGYLA